MKCQSENKSVIFRTVPRKNSGGAAGVKDRELNWQIESKLKNWNVVSFTEELVFVYSDVCRMMKRSESVWK